MRSVYIHIPFCNSICSYCDFCKFLNNDIWASNYLTYLKKEIDKYYEKDMVKTLYIGGGTPSCLSYDNLIKLFKIIRVFRLSSDYEFTYECNINDLSEEFLIFLKENGVNRLSIGVESFNKYKLKYLNRKHNKKDIFSKIALARKIGFDNINIDIIYALSIEDMSILKSDIKYALKLKVDHISTYSLIIEEHTLLHNKGVKPISEDLDFKMYKYICKTLKRHHYNHYEISNFALDGHESKHNLTYWDNNEYYGFGLGAHGYINNMRYENTRNFNKYLNEEYRLNELLISTQEEMENELILGLRKIKGVSISEFEERFGISMFKMFKIEDALDKKDLILDEGFIRINEDKLYISNEILNEIM